MPRTGRRDTQAPRTPPTPRRLAAKARALLKASGDPAVARRALTFFKDDDAIRVYGVPTALAGRIERDLFGMVTGAWTVREARLFCDLLARSPFHEAKDVGFHLLSRYKDDFDPALIEDAESWLAGGFCDNWAAVDDLCLTVISPLVRRHPALLDRVMGWSHSPNMWLRRASAVSFVPLARKGEMLGPAYRTAESLLGDGEDLIHKALGWMLREAGKTDSGRLEAFLLQHGPRIPRTTLRYAIERFPERRRRALLSHSLNGPPLVRHGLAAIAAAADRFMSMSPTRHSSDIRLVYLLGRRSRMRNANRASGSRRASRRVHHVVIAERGRRATAFSQYMADISNYGLLPKEKELEISEDISRGRAEALEELMVANLPFVVKIAAQYRGRGLPLEDLVSEGNLGLVRAAFRYDHRREVRFITYASWWIRKSILQALSDQAAPVRVPCYQRAKAACRGGPGDVTVRSLPLEEKLPGDRLPLIETLVDPRGIDPEAHASRAEFLGRLAGLLGCLDERSRIVLSRRFGLGCPAFTLREVADSMGISRERVRQIEVAADVVVAAGEGARLVRFEGPERFDVLPLLVATDGAIEAFGHDGRRLRPNIVIGGVEGLAERGWEGLRLRAGEVLIGIRDLRQRCVMTTFDPDTLEQDVGVLRRIHAEFSGSLALNCWVIEGGVLRVGDPVTLQGERSR